MAGDNKKLEGIEVADTVGSRHSHKAEQKTDTSDQAWDGGVHSEARHVDTGPLNDIVNEDATDTLTTSLRKKAKARKSTAPPPKTEPQGLHIAVYFAGGLALGGTLGAALVLLIA
jgi:hypothetical protein